MSEMSEMGRPLPPLSDGMIKAARAKAAADLVKKAIDHNTYVLKHTPEGSGVDCTIATLGDGSEVLLLMRPTKPLDQKALDGLAGGLPIAGRIVATARGRDGYLTIHPGTAKFEDLAKLVAKQIRTEKLATAGTPLEKKEPARKIETKEPATKPIKISPSYEAAWYNGQSSDVIKIAERARTEHHVSFLMAAAFPPDEETGRKAFVLDTGLGLKALIAINNTYIMDGAPSQVNLAEPCMGDFSRTGWAALQAAIDNHEIDEDAVAFDGRAGAMTALEKIIKGVRIDLLAGQFRGLVDADPRYELDE